RRRHTKSTRDWSSDVCSSDLSVLYDGHVTEKVLRELKPSKIRGVASDAMVCSAYELGISDEHEGIILLTEEVAPGTPLADFMGRSEERRVGKDCRAGGGAIDA